MTYPKGPGRTLPGSSTTQANFLREDATTAEGVEWVTAAEVLQALEEIDAAAEAAQGLSTTGTVTVLSASTNVSSKPGGTYFVAASGVTITLPNATTIDWAGINGAGNRVVTVATRNGQSAIIAAATNANTFVATGAWTTSVGSNSSGRFEADGSGHIFNV